MAEVLITLGIIGVVAALTMPSLFAKHQEKQTVVKLKKMYSVLSQAYATYLNDNEPIKTGDFEYTDKGAIGVFNVFKDYLKIAKDCGNTSKGCFYEGMYKSVDGFNWHLYTDDQRYYKVLLADGSSVLFRGGEAVVIFYDTNGAKGPNRWGYDLFEFVIFGRQLFPSGIPGKYIYDFDNNCRDGVNSGAHCTAWVVFRDNMDYLHCDDLSWNGKSKCK